VFNIHEIVLFSIVVTAGLSALLFGISMLSYYKVREIKFLFIGSAFLFFLIKSVIFYFIQNYNVFLFDVVIIVLLYLASVRK